MGNTIGLNRLLNTRKRSNIQGRIGKEACLIEAERSVSEIHILNSQMINKRVVKTSIFVS